MAIPHTSESNLCDVFLNSNVAVDSPCHPPSPPPKPLGVFQVLAIERPNSKLERLNLIARQQAERSTLNPHLSALDNGYTQASLFHPNLSRSYHGPSSNEWDV
jgi:hypothetical protein